MSIPLKSISGFPEKKNREVWPSIIGVENHGFNKALSQMETKEISFNRERLAKTVYDAWAPNHENTWESLDQDSQLRRVIQEIADTLISASSTILEVKNKEEKCSNP